MNLLRWQPTVNCSRIDRQAIINDDMDMLTHPYGNGGAARATVGDLVWAIRQAIPKWRTASRCSMQNTVT